MLNSTVNDEKTRHWSEVIKNYCQIGAIILGGWWTYRLFIKKEAPGLEARGTTISGIQWIRTSAKDETRELVFSVTLENKGSSSFDISKIRVRGWEFEFGRATNHLEFFDPEKMQSEKTFFERTYNLTSNSGPPFPSPYPPGAILTNSFIWLTKPECGKRIHVVAEFFLKGKEDVPNWFTGSSTQECLDDPNYQPAQ